MTAPTVYINDILETTAFQIVSNAIMNGVSFASFSIPNIHIKGDNTLRETWKDYRLVANVKIVGESSIITFRGFIVMITGDEILNITCLDTSARLKFYDVAPGASDFKKWEGVVESITGVGNDILHVETPEGESPEFSLNEHNDRFMLISDATLGEEEDTLVNGEETYLGVSDADNTEYAPDGDYTDVINSETPAGDSYVCSWDMDKAQTAFQKINLDLSYLEIVETATIQKIVFFVALTVTATSLTEWITPLEFLIGDTVIWSTNINFQQATPDIIVAEIPAEGLDWDSILATAGGEFTTFNVRFRFAQVDLDPPAHPEANYVTISWAALTAVIFWDTVTFDPLNLEIVSTLGDWITDTTTDLLAAGVSVGDRVKIGVPYSEAFAAVKLSATELPSNLPSIIFPTVDEGVASNYLALSGYRLMDLLRETLALELRRDYQAGDQIVLEVETDITNSGGTLTEFETVKDWEDNIEIYGSVTLWWKNDSPMIVRNANHTWNKQTKSVVRKDILTEALARETATKLALKYEKDRPSIPLTFNKWVNLIPGYLYDFTLNGDLYEDQICRRAIFNYTNQSWKITGYFGGGSTPPEEWLGKFIGHLDKLIQNNAAVEFTSDYLPAGSWASLPGKPSTFPPTPHSTSHELGGGDIVNLDPTLVIIPEVGSATYDDLKDFVNNTQSAGIISGGVITDSGGGQVDVSAGTGMIKITNDALAETKFFDWSLTENIALTDLQANYIYINYNAGTPVVLASTSNLANGRTIFNLGVVFREGTGLHILNAGLDITEVIKRVQSRTNAVEGQIVRSSGLLISEIATRYLAMSAGIMWHGYTKNSIAAVDTSGADTFEYYYLLNGDWVESDQSQIDNLQYNDVSTPGSEDLATLSAVNYGIHWVYCDIDGHLLVVYGQDTYLKLSDALDSTPPNVSWGHISAMSILIGRIIIRKSAAVFTAIETAFEVNFNPSIVTDHTDLATIGTNTHAEIDTHIADGDIHLDESDVESIIIAELAPGESIDVAIDAVISDSSYSEANWDNVTEIAPSKNAVFDKMDTVDNNIAALAGANDFKGLWDASSGSYPADPLDGDYWRVSVAGTTENLYFEVWDLIVWNGSIWQRVKNQEAEIFISVSTQDSIQEAIDLLNTVGGGTLFIEQGTHNETTDTFPLTIDMSGDKITIYGVGDLSIIDSNSTTADTIVISNASEVTIRDVKILANNLTIFNQPIIDCSDANNNPVLLERVTIEGRLGDYGYGVVISQSNIEIRFCEFIECEDSIHSSGTHGDVNIHDNIITSGGGFDLTHSNDGATSIINNHFKAINTDIAAITLNTCENAIVIGNIIDGGNVIGIYANATADCLIINNYITSTTAEGIKLDGCTDCILIGNRIDDITSTVGSDSGGIELTGNSLRNIVSGNHISNQTNSGANDQYGIFITAGSNDNILKGNAFNNNDGDVDDSGTGNMFDYTDAEAVASVEAAGLTIAATKKIVIPDDTGLYLGGIAGEYGQIYHESGVGDNLYIKCIADGYAIIDGFHGEIFKANGTSIALVNSTGILMYGSKAIALQSGVTIESQLMIGAANATWVPGSYSQADTAGAAKFAGGGVSNVGSTDYKQAWYLTLPTNRGGLKLYITGIRTTLSDADGTDYMTGQHCYGLSSAGAANLVSDPDNKTTPGTYSIAFGPTDISGYNAVIGWIELFCTGAAEIEVSIVEFECYYDD